MSINFFGLSAMGGKNYGEVWQPKTQRLMVGRDIAPMTSSEPEGKIDRGVVIGKGDDVSFMSGKIFNFAKSQAQSGLTVRGFRSFENAAALSGMEKDTYSSGITLHDSDKYQVILERSGNGYTLAAYEKDPDNKEQPLKQLEVVKFTGDAKISFNADGSPNIMTGAAALKGGELAATGSDEILVRTSGANVKAGVNTTVYNFSSQGGEFSGGSNVTYLGSYTDSLFKDSSGETTYAGYFNKSKFSGSDQSLGVFSGVFEKSDIEAGGNDDTFSGYFSESNINGGNGENTFSGLFLNQSVVKGGDDDDTFNGRFIASELFGGKGDDTFGNHIDLNHLGYIQGKQGQGYFGLGPDFIKANVDAGEGDDSFEGVAWDSQINLGEGDDQAEGIFTNSGVDGGEGNNRLTAMYSMASQFKAGSGDDEIILASAVASTVHTGEGNDKVVLGRNQDDTGSGGLGGDNLMSVTRWLTPEQQRHDERGLAFGELRANLVDASEEENRVVINNGKGTNKVATGDIVEEQEPENAEEALAGEKAAAEEQTVAAENAEFAAQSKQSADSMAILEQAMPGQPTEEEAREAKILGRYVVQTGDEALQEGGLAAVVKTGAGENLTFRGMDRGPELERISDDNAVSHLLRKASDAYSWAKKLG